MSDMIVYPITSNDRAWMTQFVVQHWGATVVVSRGVLHELDTYPGFIAREEGELE